MTERVQASEEFFELSREHHPMNDRLHEMRVLVVQGANVNHQNEDGMCAAMCLAKWPLGGLEDFLLFLRENGADFTLEDNKGYTPVKVALKNKNTEMADFLKGFTA